jgi:hypothetical protein
MGSDELAVDIGAIRSGNLYLAPIVVIVIMIICDVAHHKSLKNRLKGGQRDRAMSA